jgi:hypothetical protein
MVKDSRIKDIGNLMPLLIGRKVNVFNTIGTKDPLGYGVIRGFNNNKDQIVFEDWVWWNGDRITVNYISVEIVKKITFRDH